MTLAAAVIFPISRHWTTAKVTTSRTMLPDIVSFCSSLRREVGYSAGYSARLTVFCLNWQRNSPARSWCDA